MTTRGNKVYQENKMDSEKINSSHVSYIEVKFVINLANFYPQYFTNLHVKNCRCLP